MNISIVNYKTIVANLPYYKIYNNNNNDDDTMIN